MWDGLKGNSNGNYPLSSFFGVSVRVSLFRPCWMTPRQSPFQLARGFVPTTRLNKAPRWEEVKQMEGAQKGPSAGWL